MQRDTRRLGSIALAIVIACLLASSTAYALAGDYGAWTQAMRVESIPGTSPAFNGASLDGCPFVSRDGKTFYMASNRTGGLGGIDIWVSTRASVDDPWGEPVNVGAPVNSSANDFCPTIAAGRTPLLLRLATAQAAAVATTSTRPGSVRTVGTPSRTSAVRSTAQRTRRARSRFRNERRDLPSTSRARVRARATSSRARRMEAPSCRPHLLPSSTARQHRTVSRTSDATGSRSSSSRRDRARSAPRTCTRRRERVSPTLVDAGQPRLGGQQLGGGHATVALVGRHDAVLRVDPRRRRRRLGPLRDDA